MNIPIDRLEIHPVWGDDFTHLVGIHLIQRGEEGSAYRINLEIGEKLPEAMVFRGPDALMSREAAQWLINRLWELGFRPTGEGTAGQLKAVNNHLQDMRGLVDKLLKEVLEK